MIPRIRRRTTTRLSIWGPDFRVQKWPNARPAGDGLIPNKITLFISSSSKQITNYYATQTSNTQFVATITINSTGTIHTYLSRTIPHCLLFLFNRPIFFPELLYVMLATCCPTNSGKDSKH